MKEIREQMEEILRRRKRYLAMRQAGLLITLGSVLLALLTAVIVVAPDAGGKAQDLHGSVLGATILSAEAGAYVIVAVLAFSLGVVFTLAAQKYLKAEEERADKVPSEKTDFVPDAEQREYGNRASGNPAGGQNIPERKES